MNIIPIQLKFDKDIPVVFGNAEYEAECELLTAIDEIIRQSGIEKHVKEYFLDMAYANKSIELFGTGKKVKLTYQERIGIQDNAVLALRASILRKRLGLSLRSLARALSHSGLYQWFCRINRFSGARIPGKSHLGDLENMLPANLTRQLEKQLLRAAGDKLSDVLDTPVDFSQCYLDSTCIKANIHFPVDWVLLRDATRTMMKAVTRSYRKLYSRL